MNVKKITILSFSPNGNTSKIAKAAAKPLPEELVVEVDLTVFENRWKLYSFDRDELVILAFPVYYGRLPLVSDEVFNHISADGAAAIAMVSYSYDAGEALEEMNSRLSAQGFAVCGIAAFAGQDTYDLTLGDSRPDVADLKEAAEFGNAVFTKVSRAFEPSYAKVLYAKLESLHRAVQRPSKPDFVASRCTGCGLCAERCPVGAINPDDPAETDSFRCLLCGRCVNCCPNGARLPVDKLTEMALIARATHPEPFPNVICV